MLTYTYAVLLFTKYGRHFAIFIYICVVVQFPENILFLSFMIVNVYFKHSVFYVT